MASLSFVIGIIGNIISILVFASPIMTFAIVVRKKSTENYKGVPYITTLLSTSLWTFYGLLNPDGLLVVTVNGTGAVFQFIYVTLFLIYAPKNKKIKTAKLVALLDVGFLGLVIAVTLVAIHGSLRLTFVGILCAALTIGMYAAPLSVMVPNATGFVLGSAQLILYAMYKNKSNSAKSTEAMEDEEEGSAHLVKSGIELKAYNNSNEGEEEEEEEGDNVKNMISLNKGKSLPKLSINRQYSLQKISRTFSLSTYDLQSGWVHETVQNKT